jgi:GNAT superfamily N-acetyltransferase
MDRFINLGPDSLAEQHLCCALGDKKHIAGVQAKKDWLRERFIEGLVFRKLDVRGKVFIEYLPAAYCWRPIVAPDWLASHCLWVSGKYAGQGFAKALVDYALEDAKRQGKAGLVIAAGKKKRPFMADPKFLKHLGFQVCDQGGDWQLFSYALRQDAAVPRFSAAVHAPGGQEHFVASISPQCPFNEHWAPNLVEDLRERGHEAELNRLTSAKECHGVASPLGAFSLEAKGELFSHHLTTPNATGRMLAKREK